MVGGGGGVFFSLKVNCASFILQFMWSSCCTSAYSPPCLSFRGKTAAKAVCCNYSVLPIIMSFLLLSFILLIVVIYHISVTVARYRIYPNIRCAFFFCNSSSEKWGMALYAVETHSV